MKNWPNSGDANCRFRIKTTSDYVLNLTVGFCPRYPASDEPRTYIRLRDVNPGYYVTGYDGDFSEHPMFTKWKGFRPSYWQKAIIKPGQRTKCNDSDCGFRRIEFLVQEKDCQWIFYAPDYLPNAGLQQSAQDIKYSIEFFTCQTSAPFTERHIDMEPGKVTIMWPGVSKKNSTTNQADCPDGSIDNGKGQCLVHRKEANPADGKSPITDRLKALKKLEDAGVISKEEAAAKRKEILKNL